MRRFWVVAAALVLWGLNAAPVQAGAKMLD